MILRIRQMLRKAFLQMFRDVRMRMVVLVMPLVQMTVLAFALTTDVKDIRTAVVDPDNSPQSRRLVTAFFILVPAILLSGFIFPIRNMPGPIQWLTVINPMRWFLQVLHGIVVKGVGLRILWLPIAAQATLAACFLTLAVSRFRPAGPFSNSGRREPGRPKSKPRNARWCIRWKKYRTTSDSRSSGPGSTSMWPPGIPRRPASPLARRGSTGASPICSMGSR